MPNQLHEDILDDARLCIPYLHIMTKGKVWGTTEAMTFNPLFNCVHIGLRADAYFMPEDGAGPIMVEVGKMKDGKWAHVRAEDGLPVRILRIGFDRSCWLLNPRRTEIEDTILSFVTSKLLAGHDA